MKNMLDMDYTPRPESIEFFMKVISKHRSVETVEHVELPLFQLIKPNGNELKVLLVYVYILSESEFLEIYSCYQDIDAIVNSSNWTRYTTGAKQLAKEHGIGLFEFKEFMGALNHDSKRLFLNYISPEEREENKKNNNTAF